MISTTIEQSKKLVEIGISADSADMWWVALNWQETEYYVEVKQEGIEQPKKAIPCWSLAALLDYLSTVSSFTIDVSNRECLLVVSPVKSIETIKCYADNLVNACVEMIVKLKKEKLI